MKRRIVTIYTDASHCHKLRVAGWGCWIKADGNFGVRAFGECKAEIRSSGEAELAAIAYGIREAQKSVGIGAGDLVVIVTDSDHARSRLGPWKPNNRSSPLEVEIITFIRTAANLGGFQIRVNKVKGHSNHDGIRSSVNALVDKLAKSGLKQARERAA